MTPKNLFPAEFLELTTEYHLARHSRTSQIIYLILVFALIAFAALLPFLFIDVSVKSSGQLKAATEMTTLKATASGFLKEVFIQENVSVEKGQLVIAVQSPVLEEKVKFLKSKLEEVNRFLHDADQLSKGTFSGGLHLETGLYQQSLSDYHQKIADRQTKLLKVKQDYDRNKKLYDQQVIAATEFENFKFEYDKARNELDLLKQSQLSTWQQELRSYEKEKTDYQNQLVQTEKEKESLNIKAPISGTIQNLAGVYPGSAVFANEYTGNVCTRYSENDLY